MNFGKAISDFYKGYAVFKGRTNRSGYWLVILFYVVASTVVSTIEGQKINADTGMAESGPIANVFTLIHTLPLIAMGIRRMHDVSKSGWFLLVPIYNIILAASAGKPEENQYGSQAK